MIFFNLDKKCNFDEKISLIINTLSTFKTRNSRIFIQLFEDILKLLNVYNKEAHYIHSNTNIYQEIIFNLIKYTNTNIYNNIDKLLNTIKAENEFHTFVLINNEKYKMTKIDYLNKKINITNEIKKKFDQQKLIKILNNDLSIN